MLSASAWYIRVVDRDWQLDPPFYFLFVLILYIGNVPNVCRVDLPTKYDRFLMEPFSVTLKVRVK